VGLKAAQAGDFAGARQILTEHVPNPLLRSQALANIEQLAIFEAARKGKIGEALRLVSNLHTAKQRELTLSEILSQIGPGQKRAAAISLLEQVRGMLGTSGQAEDEIQMNALLQLAQAFARYDSKRGFEVIEPLVAQFNELSAAGITLNGFGQTFYQDGELVMNNGNSLANAANQLAEALGTLAIADFDRAKTAADRIRLAEVRLEAYLAIARQAIQNQASPLLNR
jgi:hypothetical protein